MENYIRQASELFKRIGNIGLLLSSPIVLSVWSIFIGTMDSVPMVCILIATIVIGILYGASLYKKRNKKNKKCVFIFFVSLFIAHFLLILYIGGRINMYHFKIFWNFEKEQFPFALIFGGISLIGSFCVWAMVRWFVSVYQYWKKCKNRKTRTVEAIKEEAFKDTFKRKFISRKKEIGLLCVNVALATIMMYAIPHMGASFKNNFPKGYRVEEKIFKPNARLWALSSSGDECTIIYNDDEYGWVKYEGPYRHWLPNGKGKITKENEEDSVFEGYFEDSKRTISEKEKFSMSDVIDNAKKESTKDFREVISIIFDDYKFKHCSGSLKEVVRNQAGRIINAYWTIIDHDLYSSYHGDFSAIYDGDFSAIEVFSDNKTLVSVYLSPPRRLGITAASQAPAEPSAKKPAAGNLPAILKKQNVFIGYKLSHGSLIFKNNEHKKNKYGYDFYKGGLDENGDFDGTGAILKWINESVYEGEFVQGKMKKGEFIFGDKSRYKHSFGENFNNGDKFEGTFYCERDSDDNYPLNGTLTFANNNNYEWFNGDLDKDGNLCGGKLKLKEKDIIIKICVKDNVLKTQLNGTYEVVDHAHKNLNEYKITFEKGTINKISLAFKNNSSEYHQYGYITFAGTVHDDDITKFEYGTVTYSNENIYNKSYTGPFVDNLPHTMPDEHGETPIKGTMFYSDDNVNLEKYEGAWYKGMRHGKGTLTFKNGNVNGLKNYVGNWKDNKPHDNSGKGKLTWIKDDLNYPYYYQGSFANGLFDGDDGEKKIGDICFLKGTFKDNAFSEGTWRFLIKKGTEAVIEEGEPINISDNIGKYYWCGDKKVWHSKTYATQYGRSIAIPIGSVIRKDNGDSSYTDVENFISKIIIHNTIENYIEFSDKNWWN